MRTVCNACGKTSRAPKSHNRAGELTRRTRVWKWLHRRKPRRFLVRDAAHFEAEMLAARAERDALEVLYQQLRGA